MLFRLQGIESPVQIFYWATKEHKVQDHGRDTICGIHAQNSKKLQTL